MTNPRAVVEVYRLFIVQGPPLVKEVRAKAEILPVLALLNS